ncbi:MAG TPA: 4-hydroxythreonine-4-phosphate dehydrogenase PdxA [Hyphomicrobiales bacterium]|nr:4-hydroxythreonine-4-phosphate dehydrogenase PdxA [Hyphomicrobiales bacterium]
MGDPAGIGPDLPLLTWRKRSSDPCPPFFVVGDFAVFESRAAVLATATGQDISIDEIKGPDYTREVFHRALPILPVSDAKRTEVRAGVASSAHASAVIASIEEAVAIVLGGAASAVVTSPIAKYILMRQGFPFAGHTDFLAELAARHGDTGITPVMLMASDRLMAVPVTIHIALRDVPQALTKDRIVKTGKITSEGLTRYFGIEQPRLAVCGLNPHAGEGGELGLEEIDIIAPAIEELKALGIDASGPYSADTLFHEEARRSYDAVLAMYHDQALIPFKTLSFDDGVNVTLGLPFIRTSPDHGTAFSLAGTARINTRSFLEALRLADRMSQRAQAAPAIQL